MQKYRDPTFVFFHPEYGSIQCDKTNMNNTLKNIDAVVTYQHTVIYLSICSYHCSFKRNGKLTIYK